MKYKLLAEIAEKYKEKYESYGKPSGSSSFTDVSNLVMTLGTISKYFDRLTENERIEYLKDFRISMNALKGYFELLDLYPKYKDAELYGNQPKGIVGFPDLLAYCNSEEGLLQQKKKFDSSPQVKAHYIVLSKQRLEDIVWSTRQELSAEDPRLN